MMNTTATLLRELVRIPSVNPMGRLLTGPEYLETRLTEFLCGYLTQLGLTVERQAVRPGRENVIARWEPPHPARTLLFEVHQDTVPVDGMTVDPFGGDVRAGRLYGRGACDVKGGMAAMLIVLERLVRQSPANSARVILACTVDEEHTFLGVQQLARTVRADGAIVAEPTRLKIVHAHKGVVRWHLSTRGVSCHSSRPEQGVNAIYRMGRLLPIIEKYAESLRSSIPDPLLGPPTLSVGRIEGGLSVNSVPDFCRVEIDRRLVPGEQPIEAVRHFQEHLQRHAGVQTPFECSPPWLHCPALPSQQGTAIAQALENAIISVCGRCDYEAVPYGTDASTLAAAGIPAVIFGPGDIAQAHTCDEWIELDQVETAAEILYCLATQV
jgi:acetylornithine deacetylase